MMLGILLLALLVGVVGIAVGAALIAGQHTHTRTGWRFGFATFVGLVIAGASLGTLIADEHKRVTSGVWLGIGLWITLVATVRACTDDQPGSEAAAPHSDGSSVGISG